MYLNVGEWYWVLDAESPTISWVSEDYFVYTVRDGKIVRYELENLDESEGRRHSRSLTDTRVCRLTWGTLTVTHCGMRGLSIGTARGRRVLT